MQSLFQNPGYNSFPTTYDYKSNRTIEMNQRQNMVSYFIEGEYEQNPLELLRMVFYAHGDDITYVIPAMYCTDYFAEEIAAENSGLSNSTFYTDTYKDVIDRKWICPNLTQSTIEPGQKTSLRAEVTACNEAKVMDP